MSPCAVAEGKVQTSTSISGPSKNTISIEFALHLAEILAITTHSIVVSLFMECRPQGGPHLENREEDPMPENENPDYDNCLDHPNRVADMVGYFVKQLSLRA